MAETFVRRTRIEASAEDVFRWHTRPGAFERLTPPWQRIEVIERTGGIETGARAVLRMRAGPFGIRWVAEHYDYVEGRQFRDRQVEGPFTRWEHTHRLDPDGPSACFLEDRIEYTLPLGTLGALVGGAAVRSMLDRAFRYRHAITAADVAAHAAHRVPAPLHVLVSGSTGLVGSALVPFLTTGGHHVTRLVRSQPRPGEATIHWPPATSVDAAELEGLDAAVHLAGESIAGARWTAAKKARIRDSRALGTRRLCEMLAQLRHPPRVLVSASAIGFYGDRGDALLREDSAAGTGFLAEVCGEWEAATEPVVRSGIRVIHLRIGVVLSAAGGALATMLTPFRMGLGGVLGSGKQYMSWISLDDLVTIILHALTTDTLRGPVNAVAPHPVTNREFTTTLGRVLSRPTVLPVPAAAARLAFGEMADAMLLAGARVEPARLIAAGYPFRHPNLEGALRHTLGHTTQ